jgi:hypothetical protein
MRSITIHVSDEIAESGLTGEILSSFLDIGYLLYKHHVLQKVNDLVDGNIEAIVSQRYEEKMLNFQRENLELVKRHETEIQHKSVSLAHMTEVVGELKEERRALKAKLDELYQSIYVDSVQKLKEDIKQRDLEISMLKGSNAVKGTMGEATIAEELRKTFPSCEVTNTGKVAQACDLHMTLEGDLGTIAIESKYKTCIEKRDIDKFTRDMTVLSENKKIIGGVFVSIISPNIPHKGCMCIEYVDSTPVVYLAYTDQDAFRSEFGRHIRMFVSLCTFLQEHSKSSEDTSHDALLHEVMEEVKFLQGFFNKNKKRADDIKTKFLKYISDAEDESKVVMERLEGLVKRLPKKKRRS